MVLKFICSGDFGFIDWHIVSFGNKLFLFCGERHRPIAPGSDLCKILDGRATTERQRKVRSAGRWKGRGIDEEGSSED